MFKHLQKWLAATRHRSARNTPAAKVAPCPLALEVLEPRTVFSAAPLAPLEMVGEHASAAGPAVEVRYFEIESAWLIVRSTPSDGEQAQLQSSRHDVGDPARRTLPIGEGEASSAERAPVNFFLRLEQRPLAPEGESPPGSPPFVDTVSRPAAVAPPLSRANVEPGPATNLLALWNPPAVSGQREDVLESSAVSPIASTGEKGRQASTTYNQPSAITAGDLAPRDADLAKSSRRLSESAALEEGGFIELDSLWKDASQKPISPSRPLIEPERTLKRSLTSARPAADLWRVLPPLTDHESNNHESNGRRRAELSDETRLPGNDNQFRKQQNEGGQIELTATTHQRSISRTNHATLAPLPILDPESKLDVGIGLYQAVELALVPGENPALSEPVAAEAPTMDSTTLLDALSQLLNVENVADLFRAPVHD